MQPEELTLSMIDHQRHLTTSEEIVRAVGFAVRAGHQNHTAYRFVTALVMTGNLADRADWPKILLRVMDLERAAEEGTS
jgi:hypothetical protein